VEEVRRLAAECKERREAKLKQWVQGNPTMVQLGRYLRQDEPTKPAGVEPRYTPDQLLSQPDRRWYPVIDYSRCTNCMECIDFCLFGVYGVDKLDRILVENQDNCKRGCPACSRVCPEHAIMFPDYKTPAIAGAPVGAITGLKIDLTKLFGGGDAFQIAADERDRELVRDGREAVGLTVGIPKRQANKPTEPKDDLDNLMDALDALDI
jgi:NAD-dependent dihydropyrimidine dehydrogenase PreA subunit